MRKIFSAALVAMLTFGLSGCVFLFKEAAERLVEVRTANEQVIDAQIAFRLSSELENIDEFLLHDVNLDVWQGRVLLTGVVDNARLRDAATRLARKDERISAVYNEIQIDLIGSIKGKEPPRDSEKDKIPLSQQINDILLEMTIQVRFLAADGLRAANYHWLSVRNRVYIIGLARSAEERETVLRIIRETEGVQGHKDFIEVRPEK